MLKRLNADIKEAMVEKNTIKKDVLKMVLNTAQSLAKEEKVEVKDEHVKKAITKEIKQLNETVELVGLSTKLGKESVSKREVLNSYLPEQLSRDEVVSEVTKIVSGIDNVNMGTAMRAVKAVLDGKADNKVIAEVVKEVLNNR